MFDGVREVGIAQDDSLVALTVNLEDSDGLRLL
jgi:hypothetical protein